MNAATALALLAQTEMKPFTKADWMSFAGAETENPLIGENGDFLLVLDGTILEIFEADNENGSYMFNLVDAK